MVTTVADIHAAARKNLIRLTGTISQSEWGQPGADSLVAQLGSGAVGPNFSVEGNKRYAQITIGTHSGGVAYFYHEPGKTLLSQVRINLQHFLGAAFRKWPRSTHLPFTFNVLSVAQPLQPEVRTSKDIAEVLRLKHPRTFVDSNLKPEILLAVGEPIKDAPWGEGVVFTAFAGFLPPQDVAKSVADVEEFRLAIGNDELFNKFTANPTKTSLQSIFSTLVSRPHEAVAPHIRALVERIKKGSWPTDPAFTETSHLITRLDARFPGDPIVLAAPFFLNFVKLRRGEALYLTADTVSLTFEGTVVTCTAINDGARAQPALKELVDALSFTPREASSLFLKPKRHAGSKTGATQVYAPEHGDFIVLASKLAVGAKETLEALGSPAVGIVTAGQVRVTVGEEHEELGVGGIVFVAPGHETVAEAVDQESEILWAAAQV